MKGFAVLQFFETDRFFFETDGFFFAGYCLTYYHLIH